MPYRACSLQTHQQLGNLDADSARQSYLLETTLPYRVEEAHARRCSALTLTHMLYTG